MAKKAGKPAPHVHGIVTWPEVFLKHLGTIVVTLGTSVPLTLCVVRAEPGAIPGVVKDLVQDDAFWLMGWIVAGIITLAAIAVIWFINRSSNKEIARLAHERDHLQQQLLGRTSLQRAQDEIDL
jgi:hypothetical protein